MQGYCTKLPLEISGNISSIEIKCSFLKTAKWLCRKIWVNQHSSWLHILCIVILVFLYLTKPFPPFIDRWKSPCAFLLWGYCMSLGSPLSLTRLLLWHALYRLKLELRVHMQVANCPLRSSFQKRRRDMKGGIINLVIQSSNWQTILPEVKLSKSKSPKVVSVITGSRSEPLRYFPEWTRGKSCQQHRHRVPLWSQDHIRHEAVHSMPAGFHSLSFTFFPLLPMDETIILLYYFTATNTVCHNLAVSIIFITRNPKELGVMVKKNICVVCLFYIFLSRRQCIEELM